MLNLKKNNIKNIIFDLGGIILNIDFNRSIKEFDNIGFSNFGQILHNYFFSDYFHSFERGTISELAFISKIKNLSDKPLNDSNFYYAWNKMLLDFPEKRIKKILSLKKNYKLFLLSNTNIIHYNYYNKIFTQQYNLNGLEALFNKAYFSHQIGMRKPDEEIFKFVLDENKLNPNETLFIDDFEENIATALSLQIKTLKIETNQNFYEFLDF